MSGIGFVLLLSGVVLVLCGVLILILAAIQLIRQMFKPAVAPAGGAAPPAPGVNLADLTKLIEAIVKMPQWLLAIAAGDVQIWLGFVVDKNPIKFF